MQLLQNACTYIVANIKPKQQKKPKKRKIKTMIISFTIIFTCVTFAIFIDLYQLSVSLLNFEYLL